MNAEFFDKITIFIVKSDTTDVQHAAKFHVPCDIQHGFVFKP